MTSAPKPIPLEDAQARLLDLVPSVQTEQCPVEQALGRYLASPLTALRTQPPADLSAMDGFAVSGTAPWKLVGESRCGAPFLSAIQGGGAVHISTGAIVPDGAEKILLKEHASLDGTELQTNGKGEAQARHIRKQGFDFRSGDVLLEAGHRLNAAALALALGGGHSVVPVARKPHIVILDSGDELCADPAHCLPGQIPASNGVMLAAMASAVPCTITRIGPVADNREALANALASATGADLLVTSGGASIGDHDLIRPALEDWGADLAFWRVAIKPGKPLMVARRDTTLVLGLPGNPVSSFVTGWLFMLPVLRALSGASHPLPSKVFLPSGMALAENGARRNFLRAHWDGKDIYPVPEQDSSALGAIASANALVERPENSPATEAGAIVPVYLL